MSGQGDPNQDKNSYAILWIIALIMGAGFLIWWFFAEQLKWAFIYVRKYEAMSVAFFTDKLDPLIRSLDTAIPAEVTSEAVIFVSNEVGSYLMYPSIAILILLGLFMLKNHSFLKWHTAHNMNTLVRQEQNNWPQISPVVALDLVDIDVREGEWAMAQNPMQFAKKQKILEVEKGRDDKAIWKAEDTYTATLIKDKCQQVFINQMGPPWQGVDRLNPHTKALFSIFCARIEHEADEAREYIYELAKDAAKGEMKYSRTDEFLKKYGSAKAVKMVCSRHAYVYTLMASMIELSRVDGVFASADFLWLKPLDRKLWYMLNTVGRQTAPSEVAGPWAHWLAEKEMHRALSVPMVEQGIVALEQALTMMVYKPEDDEFPDETPEEV